MSTLQEAAFLRSLSLDDAEVDRPEGTCPQPGILWSLMQKDAGESTLAEDLRNHIAVCPSCLDLATRLNAFHRAVRGEINRKAEKSWAESRPRLNQWLDTFLEQTQPEVRPAPKPMALVTPPVRRRFFRLAWAMPLAAAMAVLAVVLLVQSRHTGGQQSGAQIATGPLQPENHPSAAPPNAPSADQPMLMKNNGEVPAGNSAGEVPETIAFNGGERLKLQLTSVELLEDGSYQLTGRLAPIDSQNAVLDSAEVSGIYRPAQPQGRLELSINAAGFKNRSYRVLPNGIDDQVRAVTLHDHVVPRIGETVEIRVKHGPNLHLEP
jgi:hypothetical protein